jgi:hypothetical protein
MPQKTQQAGADHIASLPLFCKNPVQLRFEGTAKVALPSPSGLALPGANSRTPRKWRLAHRYGRQMLKMALPLASVLIVAGLGFGTPGLATDDTYLGVWTIVGSQPAPWAIARGLPVQSDVYHLVGKAVTFYPDHVMAPSPLTCGRRHYAIKNYTADMLFQGNLGNPREEVAALGYQGGPIKTFETSCGGILDFHFVDHRTAMFALYNRIYRLEHRGL